MEHQAILAALRAVLGPDGVLHEPADLALYEYDASIDKGRPDFVVFPRTTEDVVAIAQIATRERIPFFPRGAGTGLSGGAVADQGGITLAMSRMNHILAVDPVNMRATVQPGVVNADISAAVAGYGLYYVPDPSSQRACTIGGNVAENSGGPHCLAYGMTTNHVIGLEVVLPDGAVIETDTNAPGYDLTGVLVGSEGTLGIVTKCVIRLMPLAEAVRTLLVVFGTVEQASEAVSAIIADGTIPAAIEMMDNTAIVAVEAAKRCGYPTDAAAVLLIDVEGLNEGLDELSERIGAICEANGATDIRAPQGAAEREKLWSGRKGAFGAMGRLAPSYYVQDGVIPRSKLPQVLRQIGEIGRKNELRIANVFHAGDGNLHPLILFDERDEALTIKVIEAGNEILQACIDAGGSITGEHGVGLEKRDLMAKLYSADDLGAMTRLKAAFNPDNLLNPCKMFPATKMCIETWHRRREIIRRPIKELSDAWGGMPIP
ncbi:MAG: FAD-binding protein [Chloroflexi bacterium]|nr:FAD-binding protein [Chloroflexota bacterium]